MILLMVLVFAIIVSMRQLLDVQEELNWAGLSDPQLDAVFLILALVLAYAVMLFLRSL
jgi:hypothetical protein